MKAIVCPKYGPPDVLRFEDVEKPVPGDHEVLIRVHAATVTMGDCEMRGFRFPLWLRPLARLGFGITGPRKRILGQELAGEVEAVGKGVTRFRTGDRVFGATGYSLGAYAEYTCLPETGAISLKPASVTYPEAATLPVGGLEALHFLKKADIRSGDEVLINGAGGSIGTFAVQLARYFGAEVTGVDSGEKLAMLRSIGADSVLDYVREDFTKNGKAYDVIFDVTGKSPFSHSLRSLKPGGCYLLANPGLSQMVRGALTSRLGSKKVIFGAGGQKSEDLAFLAELLAAGKIKSIIDRRYPLERTAEAHTYVETGQKKGNVVIMLDWQKQTTGKG